MPTATFQPGESFPLQIAWRLPDGDYLRAVFQADVLDLVPKADKYLVLLSKLIAGRQENSDGVLQPQQAFSREYWEKVNNLVGRRITIAYEADDSHAIHMRLATLTGEHNFFSRYDDVEVMTKGILAASRRKEKDEEEWSWLGFLDIEFSRSFDIYRLGKYPAPQIRLQYIIRIISFLKRFELLNRFLAQVSLSHFWTQRTIFSKVKASTGR